MVMGPTHAMSGAAAGLAVAAVIPPAWGGPTTAVGALTFAAVTAGAALLPDIDSPQATVSRSFGPLSVGLAHATENGALAVYRVTRTRRDSDVNNGHRTATHTIWFAVLAGILCAVIVAMFGQTGAVAVLFVMLGLAVRGLVPKWSRKTDWLAVTALSLGAAIAVWTWQPQTAGALAIGVAVAVGVLTHLAGDFLTKSGVPLLGGVVAVNGKRWWDFAPPGPLRIKANGAWDQLLLGVFTVAAIALAYLVTTDPSALGATWPPIGGQVTQH